MNVIIGSIPQIRYVDLYAADCTETTLQLSYIYWKNCWWWEIISTSEIVYGKPNGTVWPGYLSKAFSQNGPNVKTLSLFSLRMEIWPWTFAFQHLLFASLCIAEHLQIFRALRAHHHDLYFNSAESADHHWGNEGFWYTWVWEAGCFV